jgi:hypothetical protein
LSDEEVASENAQKEGVQKRIPLPVKKDRPVVRKRETVAVSTLISLPFSFPHRRNQKRLAHVLDISPSSSC